MNKQTQGNKMIIPINDLLKGLYLLRAINKDNDSETQKLVIE